MPLWMLLALVHVKVGLCWTLLRIQVSGTPCLCMVGVVVAASVSTALLARSNCQILSSNICLKDSCSFSHPLMYSLSSWLWPVWAGCWPPGSLQPSLYLQISLYTSLFLSVGDWKPLVTESPTADSGWYQELHHLDIKDMKNLHHQFQIQSLIFIVKNGRRQDVTRDVRRCLMGSSAPLAAGVAFGKGQQEKTGRSSELHHVQPAYQGSYCQRSW